MNVISIKTEQAPTFRKNIAKKFELVIQDEAKATNLEKGLYNYVIKEAKARKVIRKWDNKHFVKLYMAKLWTIHANLKKTEILEQIKSDELSPQQFAFMTHQEISPEHWKDLIERKIQRDESKFTQRVEASTDMFTCRKCKSKRCTYYELRTRSADEPATIFVTCLDCGKNWKS